MKPSVRVVMALIPRLLKLDGELKFEVQTAESTKTEYRWTITRDFPVFTPTTVETITKSGIVVIQKYRDDGSIKETIHVDPKFIYFGKDV